MGIPVRQAAGVGKGLALAGWDDVTGLAAFLSDPVSGLKGLKDLITDPEVRQQLGDSLVAEFDAKITRVQTSLKVGGTDHALQLGEDVGKLVWQVGTVVTGAGGATKAAVTLAKVGIDVSKDALVLMEIATPSLITGLAADAARTFRFTDDMLPALTILKRNDGVMGKFIATQLIKEASGKQFVPIQNASGHGADLVDIDHATKTIYHVESDSIAMPQGPESSVDSTTSEGIEVVVTNAAIRIPRTLRQCASQNRLNRHVMCLETKNESDTGHSKNARVKTQAGPAESR